ncbi:MAG: hypothetical protein GY859_16275 [Desulfobacterales bacterium]|nr:hypothetical protein [Desulfobacterales bacterium]
MLKSRKMTKDSPGATLPGFPCERKLLTREERAGYFAGEKIQCLICGGWFRELSDAHLHSDHGVTLDEYRERFGLPANRGGAKNTALRARGGGEKKSPAHGKATLPARGVGGMKSPARGKATFPASGEGGMKTPAHGKATFPARGEGGKESPAHGEASLPARGAFSGGGALKRPEPSIRRGLKVKSGLVVRKRTMRYPRKEFNAILRRMRTQKRSLGDVCGDPDLPSLSSWKKFEKLHPVFTEKAHQVHHSLSYPEQLRIKDISPRFRVDCERLRAQGATLREISHLLGGSVSSVRKALSHLTGIKPKNKRLKYKVVLDRMLGQRRTLAAVCKDAGCPDKVSWMLFAEKHPEYLEKAREIQYSLPYSLQLKSKVVSPRFHIDCNLLRSTGMTMNEIAYALGVSRTSVRKNLPDEGETDESKAQYNNPW